MEFRWRYQDAQGRDVAGPDVMFVDQTEAEEWFSAEWRVQRDPRVENVTPRPADSPV